MGERLNTQNLVDLLVENQGFDRKKAENFIKEFFALIEEGLEQNKSVKIKGFGTFKLVDVESRESVNVNTGERIVIEGHTKISFIPDVSLKDVINKPFAHFETVVLNDDVDFTNMNEEIKDDSEIEEDNDEEIRDDATHIIDDNEEKEEEKEEEVVSVTEIVDEEAETQAETVAKKKETVKKTSNSILIVVILIAVLSCGVFLYLIFADDIFPPTPKQPTETLTVLKDSIAQENVTDSIAMNEVQTDQKSTIGQTKTGRAVEKPTTTPPRSGNAVPFSQIPVNPDSTSYEIVGTKAVHTVKDGETLIRLSYKYYGTKDLFPYIIKHNRSISKNPNNLPIGSIINIPELKKKR